jgi:hypothetical protein
MAYCTMFDMSFYFIPFETFYAVCFLSFHDYLKIYSLRISIFFLGGGGVVT